MNFDKELYSLCKAVDNHGSYEKLPDMEKLKADADSIFKKMTEEEGPFPDLDRIEKNDTEKKDNGVQSDVSKKDSTSDKVENIFRSKMAGGFGKIDITKDIELSDDKKKEIRVEAEKEAKHSDEPLEKIIERKENEVKDEIRAVAKDIVHYKDVMTKLSALGIPDRYLSRYTPLMRMKLEYDSAIRKAESMGCKVGEDCFIKKSVSILEVRLEQLEYYRSDMPTSRVMEAILGIKTTKDDLYKETVEKDGKTETIEHASYSKYVAALEPFYAIGGGLGTLLGFLPIYPKEKNDVEKSETQDISGKDMEKEDMPGNEDKIEKPDGEDKTDVPDAHLEEGQVSQEKEDIEQPQEQIEIPENDLTASESTGITNDVQNDTVDSKDTEPEHADIEKEKGKEDMPDEAERKGLGTPATRAAIIEKLVSGGFVERKGKNLIPTKAGVNLVTVLPELLTSPKLTADWEQRLNEVAKGQASPEDFMDGIEAMAAELVRKYSHISEDGQKLFQPEKETVGLCPRCGKPVYEGKKNFACSDRACQFVMWKNDRFWTSRRKEMTRKMAADLLKKGRTSVKGMWSEKKGSTYDAVVVLNDTGGKYVNFKLEFPKRKDGVHGKK